MSEQPNAKLTRLRGGKTFNLIQNLFFILQKFEEKNLEPTNMTVASTWTQTTRWTASFKAHDHKFMINLNFIFLFMKKKTQRNAGSVYRSCPDVSMLNIFFFCFSS